MKLEIPKIKLPKSFGGDLRMANTMIPENNKLAPVFEARSFAIHVASSQKVSIAIRKSFSSEEEPLIPLIEG